MGNKLTHRHRLFIALVGASKAYVGNSQRRFIFGSWFQTADTDRDSFRIISQGFVDIIDFDFMALWSKHFVDFSMIGSPLEIEIKKFSIRWHKSIMVWNWLLPRACFDGRTMETINQPRLVGDESSMSVYRGHDRDTRRRCGFEIMMASVRDEIFVLQWWSFVT